MGVVGESVTLSYWAPNFTDLIMRRSDNIKNARAFTLVELLVVIAIIAVLAGIVLPVFSKVKESGNSANCVSNLRQMATAALTFAADNDGVLPGEDRAGGGSWGDVMNHVMGEEAFQRFGSNADGSHDKGHMTCRSVHEYGNRPFWFRAYVGNRNLFRAVKKDSNGDDIRINFGPFTQYQVGARLMAFSEPSKIVMIWEAASLGSDLSSAAWGASGTISLAENDNMIPPWASEEKNGLFAFRHNLSTNIVFLDGHVKNYSYDEVKDATDPNNAFPLNTWNAFSTDARRNPK